MTLKMDVLKLELKSKGLPHVQKRGNPNSPVVFLGEAGGADEAQQGTAFVGAAGRELGRMLDDAGLCQNDVWFSNPYQTRPPDNKIDRIPELGIRDEVYLEAFLEELETYKPKFIVPTGVPLGILCPFTKSYKKPFNAQITKYQGSLLTSPLLKWEHYVIPCLHPAYLFKHWSDRVVAVLCLEKVSEELAFWRLNGCLQPLPQRKLLAEPAADDAIDYLRQLLQMPPDKPISIDIENIGVYRGKDKTPQQNRLPYVVGFAPSAKEAISIGLAEYETGKTEVIWLLIDRLLRERRVIGQNFYTHDGPWLNYIGFNSGTRRLEDTLVRHHVLWPELSHKLEFQTIQYTREPYYKSEGHNWTVKERARLKRYNCKDCCVTYEVWERQEEEFKEREK